MTQRKLEQSQDTPLIDNGDNVQHMLDVPPPLVTNLERRFHSAVV